jgi:hypothetical protein
MVMGVMELGVKNLVQSHEIGRQNSHGNDDALLRHLLYTHHELTLLVLAQLTEGRQIIAAL